MQDQDLLISESATLLEVLDALNRCPERTFMVERGGKLVAMITDGDIRRWILQHRSLDATAKDFANYQPKTLLDSEFDAATDYTRLLGFRVIPVVDREMNIVHVIRSGHEQIPSPNPCANLQVVINAGGKGTRLYPYTKILPKPLIPIGEEPITEIIINRFYKLGCRNFHMIVNHKKNMIKSYFNEVEKPYSLSFAEEEVPLGTGGGLTLLRGKLNDTFVFTNCDTIIDEDFQTIVCAHKKRGNLVTMICSLKDFQFPYGVVTASEDGAIEAFSEKPRMSYFVNTGCYIVEPAVLDFMTAGEEVGFPTVIDRLRSKGELVGIYPIGSESWLDMGQFDTLDEMRIRLGG